MNRLLAVLMLALLPTLVLAQKDPFERDMNELKDAIQEVNPEKVRVVLDRGFVALNTPYGRGHEFILNAVLSDMRFKEGDQKYEDRLEIFKLLIDHGARQLNTHDKFALEDWGKLTRAQQYIGMFLRHGGDLNMDKLFYLLETNVIPVAEIQLENADGLNARQWFCAPSSHWGRPTPLGKPRPPWSWWDWIKRSEVSRTKYTADLFFSKFMQLTQHRIFRIHPIDKDREAYCRHIMKWE